MVIPVVGALVVILGAFFGKNRTQRNFFRAIVMWHLIVYAFLALFIALGLFDAFWPTFFQYAQTLLEKLRLFINPS